MQEHWIQLITNIQKWQEQSLLRLLSVPRWFRQFRIYCRYVPLTTAFHSGFFMLCFVYVGVYFWREAKYVPHWLKSQRPEENRYEYAY